MALDRLTSHDKWAKKRAREIFFLGASYSAQEAYEMGMVNAVVPHAKLEQTAFSWAKEIMTKSPTAIKMLKFGFNLIDDGLVGQQVYAGEATRLAYGTEEAKEGRDAFFEKNGHAISLVSQVPLTEHALPFGHEHGPIVLFGFDGIGNVRLQPESEGDLVFVSFWR